MIKTVAGKKFKNPYTKKLFIIEIFFSNLNLLLIYAFATFDIIEVLICLIFKNNSSSAILTLSANKFFIVLLNYFF